MNYFHNYFLITRIFSVDSCLNFVSTGWAAIYTILSLEGIFLFSVKKVAVSQILLVRFSSLVLLSHKIYLLFVCRSLVVSSLGSQIYIYFDPR